MDWTVCGTFFTITCGTWIALWNGAIGAFVAALVGGYVAWKVVQLTGHQQKVHAAQAREIAAIADVVALAEAMATNWQDDGYEIDGLFFKFRAALLRLRLAGPDTEVLARASEWPLLLAELTDKARTSGPSEGIGAAAVLINSVNSLTEALVLWTKDGKDSRRRAVLQLGIATDALKKSAEKVSA